MPRARNYHSRQCPPPQRRSGHLHRQGRHTTAVPPRSNTHYPRPSPRPASALAPTATTGPYYYGYFSPHYHIPRHTVEFASSSASSSSQRTSRFHYNLHQEIFNRLHNVMMNLSLLDGPSTSDPIFPPIFSRFRDPDDDDDSHDLILVSPDEYHDDIVFDSNGGLSEESIDENLRIGTRVVSDDDDDTTGMCVVCQDDLFGENEKIATLGCGHDYHVECITKWLLQKNCCPVCKAIGLDVN